MTDDAPAGESRGVPRAVPWLATALLLLGAPLAFAQEESCSDCHEEALAAGSIHTGFACTDCHSDLDGYPHPEEPARGAAVCGECHEAGEELAASAHGVAEVTCFSCHGPAHEVRAVADPASAMSPLRQLATCGGCHETEDGLVEGYLVSIHGRALVRSGLVTAAPSCSDCHGGHGILPAADERSRISHAQVPETCGSCHQTILGVWRGSAHGAAWESGETRVAGKEVPVCTTCHASHRILPPTQPEARLKSPETCGGCHTGRFSTFRDSFHGKATDLGFVTAAICSDCHTPHDNLPAEDPRSSVHPDNLRSTCGHCHGEVTQAFASFDPHADPTDPAAGALHGVWLAMTALLIAVFGFFGLHDLLWLQRSLVALGRGELAEERRQDGAYVRRFSRGQIRLHVVVIVTFFVLAATGLPLKLHTAEWAKALVSFEGGVALARLLHRLAAILTFGYFVAHLGMVFRRSFLQREKGMFWGWKSMVPRAKDVVDLWQNLKYFLYLRQRPRFDRWTYWEKFDYFAVFWGVAIIGCSGLMLWFPELVTRLLPGWTLNAALVIHSDEALLAVGFIFIFHFFHTHLRPESFPMDPVIFTGRVPLVRFQRERPEEYARLVERGELEARMTEAPTAAERRRALILGLGAVAVGLLLVLGILWGMMPR